MVLLLSDVSLEDKVLALQKVIFIREFLLHLFLMIFTLIRLIFFLWDSLPKFLGELNIELNASFVARLRYQVALDDVFI